MKFLRFDNTSSLLVTILNELGVKHTRTFSNNYYEQHPNKNNLYGISQMLTDYRIESEGLRIQDKAGAINDLPTPIVAQINNDFVVIKKIYLENIEYIWKEQRIHLSVAEFLKIWSGIVLIVEPREFSIEPNYKDNRKAEIKRYIGKQMLLIAIFLLMTIGFIKSNLWHEIKMYLAILLNGLGSVISYLLFLKQIRVHSNTADKVCSLFTKKRNCNNLLDSNKAKLLGIGLSEIGLAYFTSNIIIILFFSFLYPYLAIINICSLPFTLWSLWYQKFRINQWCPLCVIIQIILWLLFIVNYTSGLITLLDVTLENILLTAYLYFFSLLILVNFSPYIIKLKEHATILQEFNSLKANEDIFKMMLKSNKKHEARKNCSSVLLGHSEADNLITIITNPHCTSCAKIHSQIVNLINNASNGYCLQLVFTTFFNTKEDILKLFLAIYFQKDKLFFLDFLDEWYKYGRFDENKFLKKYSFDVNDIKVSYELDKHREFINTTNIKSTPTILFNGYEFPLSKYKLSDLILLKGIIVS